MRRLPRGRAARREGGFTLVETLALLGLVALAATLATPRIGAGTGSARLAALAADMAAALVETRSLAISGQGEAIALADPAGRRLVAGSRIVSVPADVDMEVLAAGSCTRGPGGVGIAFRATGASCGAVIRLARGERSLRVRVEWYSGHVDILRG